METLKINQLVKENENLAPAFLTNIQSDLTIHSKLHKVEVDFEWLDLMEDTIHYLDNILRNPNRFIVNDEEIVKIELARRITVESIRHLSKHTNYIREIDKNGDVIPSNILNINKNESYNTYENRFIYTLVGRMRDFVSLKKRDLITSSSFQKRKGLDYQATCKLGNEKISMNMNVNSQIDTKEEKGISNGKTVEERIDKLEADLLMLMNTETYKDLQKQHVALVIPPIKKTNVILKNVNFQYAMKLWDYLQSHVATDTKDIKENKDFQENGELREYVDETFLLNYMVLNHLDQHQDSTEILDDEIIRSQITNQLIEKIIEINSGVPEDQIQDFIERKVMLVKDKKVAILNEIRMIFSKQFQKYLDKISAFHFEEDSNEKI